MPTLDLAWFETLLASAAGEPRSTRNAPDDVSEQAPEARCRPTEARRLVDADADTILDPLNPAVLAVLETDGAARRRTSTPRTVSWADFLTRWLDGPTSTAPPLAAGRVPSCTTPARRPRRR